MTLDDLDDNYELLLEPFDAHWRAWITRYEPERRWNAVARTPTGAIEGALKAVAHARETEQLLDQLGWMVDTLTALCAKRGPQ